MPGKATPFFAPKTHCAFSQRLGTREIVNIAIMPMPSKASKSSDSRALTPRESQIAGMLSLANKEIAFRLQISEPTVKDHVGAILAKLGAANRTEAALIVAGLRNERIAA